MHSEGWHACKVCQWRPVHQEPMHPVGILMMDAVIPCHEVPCMHANGLPNLWTNLALCWEERLSHPVVCKPGRSPQHLTSSLQRRPRRCRRRPRMPACRQSLPARSSRRTGRAPCSRSVRPQLLIIHARVVMLCMGYGKAAGVEERGRA